MGKVKAGRRVYDAMRFEVKITQCILSVQSHIASRSEYLVGVSVER